MEERYLVEHVGDPLALLLPVHVNAPQRVVERLAAHVNLCGEGLLREVLYGSRHLEVFREVVLPVHSEHGLALLTVVAVALQRHVDRRARIDDALVEDGHLASAIVDRIVGVFGELHATCRNDHRALRHIVCAERDDVGCRAFKLSRQHVLVFLCYLLGNGLGRVVKLGERIFLCLVGRHATAHEKTVYSFSERLCLREEHATVGHGVALDKVEIAVRVRFVVVVETVGTEGSDDRLVLGLWLRQVREVHACRIALKLDVKAELLFLHL